MFRSSARWNPQEPVGCPLEAWSTNCPTAWGTTATATTWMRGRRSWKRSYSTCVLGWETPAVWPAWTPPHSTTRLLPCWTQSKYSPLYSCTSLVILSPHILFSNCSITQHLIHYQMITTSHEFQTKRRSVKTARRDCSLYFKKSNRNYFQNARRKILLWKSSLKSPKTFCYVFFRHWETPGMPSKCFTTTNQRMVKDWCQPWFGVWKIQPFLRKFLGLLFWWVALLTSKRPFNVQMTLLKERCFKDLMLLKVYIKLKVYISVIIFMTGMSSVQESISQVISSAHSNLSSFKQTSFFEMQV